MQLAARSTHANVEVYLGSAWAPHGDVSFVVDAHANAKHVQLTFPLFAFSRQFHHARGRAASEVVFGIVGEEASVLYRTRLRAWIRDRPWRLSRRTAITHTSTLIGRFTDSPTVIHLAII
jgi:hypothetical protein